MSAQKCCTLIKVRLILILSVDIHFTAFIFSDYLKIAFYNKSYFKKIVIILKFKISMVIFVKYYAVTICLLQEFAFYFAAYIPVLHG